MNLQIILTLVCLTFFTCKKIDVPKDTPRCIKKKIREVEKKEQDYIAPFKVYEYTYQGKTVYYIPNYCCYDGYSDLYDDECNLICHPDGGMNGNGDGKCPDFHSSKTNERLIWE